MAYRRMNAGKLDEAREMLNFFEVPGGLQQYGAGPVDSLAGCYQAQGRHEEALELCQQMLDAFPQLGRQFKFRKFVLVSEQALEREETILPTQSPGLFALFNPKNEAYSPGQHWAAIGVVAFGLALIGAVLSNTFIRRNRTVYLVSGFAQPSQVQIDGGTPISVRGRATTTLSEGKHHAKVLSPIQTEFDFDMQTSYLSRWDKKPAWVLNVGSTVPLLEETLIYATNPRPGVSKYLEMQPFTFIPHIDYPFEEPPKELKLESRTSEVKKTSLSVPPHQPSGILASLGTPAVALVYAEDQLAVHPDDLTLLRNYADLATDEATTVRVEKFLKAGLSKRPLHIGWHRAYQDLFKKSGGEPQVIAEYDALLQAEPGNGGLIYLRGRVDPDEQKSAELYRQAATADEQLPWPWFGLAVQAGSRADWQECAQCVEIARERNLDPALIQHLRHVAMLAVNTPNMEHVARLELAADPTNAGLLLPMCDILAVKGDREGAMHALTVWESRSALPADVSIAVRQPVLYMLGDFAALNKSLKEQPEFSAPGLRREALLLEGRAKEAAEDPQLVAQNDDPWAMLSLSLGFGLAKDPDNAALWRQRAAKRLEREDARGKFVAQLLTADAAPTLEATNDVSLYINHKPLLVAALLQKFPEQRATYAPLLEKLLVSRMQPYHLAKRVLDAK